MDPDLCKALYKAATEGDHSTLRSKLLEAAKDGGLVYHNKNTLLHIAANYDNVEVVKVIREKLSTTPLRSMNYRKDTALHIAARHNNLNVVNYLLDWANEVDEEENQSERHKIVKKKNRDGNTALHEAVLGRHHRVIEVLMESVKELIFIKNRRKESPLYLAADRGLLDVLVKMLKVALEDPDFKDKKDYIIYDGPNGRTPLHAVIARKHKSCINILLDKKELISRADADGRNPLHHAASYGHYEETCCLLRIKEASFAHQMDNNGLYPIHIAANEGHVDIVNAMVEFLPETIDSVNEQDENVVHLAAKFGRSKLVSYMLKQKSRFDKLFNGKDINGNTPLHLATVNSHPKVVSILTQDRNVDMTIMNDEGLTALGIAEKEQMNEISLPKVLTLTALRINGASSGPPSPIIEENKQKDIGPSTRNSPNNKDNTSKDDQKTENHKDKFKQRFNTLALVATLIMTVSFTAGFTVPGGYNADGPYKGMAVLLRKPTFIVFVICNTMALYLSIVVVVNNILAQWVDNRLLIIAVDLSSPLLGIALILMAIAFAAGLYSVILKLQWLAFLVLVIGAIFLCYIVDLLVLFNIQKMSKDLVLRAAVKWSFNLLIWAFDRFFDNRTAH
ncbi:protein ACCELERATED CELL DEATH 6-like [Macadamia integrifolia]|uniref:protein ACCELERATED CELL DEATH 6-like n=1 Tax=Macadamia integrifolia TaxID=60698 RepID=UPI001C4E87EE|nr:protein ACCELERATED CELL DEATH 6-like [Macadamia integrifolia]